MSPVGKHFFEGMTYQAGEETSILVREKIYLSTEENVSCEQMIYDTSSVSKHVMNGAIYIVGE